MISENGFFIDKYFEGRRFDVDDEINPTEQNSSDDKKNKDSDKKKSKIYDYQLRRRKMLRVNKLPIFVLRN